MVNPPNSYYDDRGRLHIVRPANERAQADAEFEALKKKRSTRKARSASGVRHIMNITYEGKLFVGNFGALRDWILEVGWETVRDLNFMVGDAPLIDQVKYSAKSIELVDGWYINCNIPPEVITIKAYLIAKALGKKIVITWDPE